MRNETDRKNRPNDDPHGVPDGCTGYVDLVDDIGQVHMVWNTAGSLALIPGVDDFHVVK